MVEHLTVNQGVVGSNPTIGAKSPVTTGMITNLKVKVMTKTNDAAKKSRQTKLSKKTNEELINIILKKDNVEKNLQSQICRLKNEVNTLDGKCEKKDSEIEFLNRKTVELKDSLLTVREQLDSALENVRDYRDKLDAVSKEFTLKEVECNSLRKVAIIASVFVVICIIGWIFS